MNQPVNLADVFMPLVELQQEHLKRWASLVEKSDQAAWDEAYDQSLARCSEAVDSALDLQAGITHDTLKPFSEGRQVPEFVKQAAQELEQTAEAYLDARRQIWHAWFGLWQQAGSGFPSARWSQHWLAGWKELATQALDAAPQSVRVHGTGEAGNSPPAQKTTAQKSERTRVSNAA